MSTKKFCDRCGAEIEAVSAPRGNKITVHSTGRKPLIDDMDICIDCITKLNAWWDRPQFEDMNQFR